jgi:hypothetical protein
VDAGRRQHAQAIAREHAHRRGFPAIGEGLRMLHVRGGEDVRLVAALQPIAQEPGGGECELDLATAGLCKGCGRLVEGEAEAAGGENTGHLSGLSHVQAPGCPAFGKKTARPPIL